MKRFLCLMMISAASFSTFAQEGNSPAAVAARQEAIRGAEEQYKRMAADIEQLTANNQALQEKIAKMAAEMENLREEQRKAATAAANSGVQDDLKRLADKIQEVDRKRESDKQVISDEINKAMDKLRSTIKETAAPAPRPAPKSEKTPTASIPDTGFKYTIESGDTLKKIVNAYNAEFKSKGMKTITAKQVKDANPNVKNWDNLIVGRKLLIPDPSSAN